MIALAICVLVVLGVGLCAWGVAHAPEIEAIPAIMAGLVLVFLAWGLSPI